MMHKNTALLLAGVLFGFMAILAPLSSPALIAATMTAIPTSTPGTMYTRSELLTKISPYSIPATPAFQSLQLPEVSTNTILTGVGIGQTFNQMLRGAGVFGFITGVVILLAAVFWMQKKIMEITNKRTSSEFERNFVKFRREFKSFRGQFRSKRRR